MKSSPLVTFSLLTASLLFLFGCNNNESPQVRSETSTDTTASNMNAASTTPVSTIVTTPQSMLIIKHRVKNFATWKIAYDADDSARLANGLHNYVISRGLEDTNMVMVALKADDMTQAKTFSKNPALRQAMQKGGVIGMPSMQFTTTTFQDTVKLNTDIRSLTSFEVKDWAAWEKAFKQGEQERIDNGLTVRTYGHDADDNNKVRLVTALVDTAKAYAYWKSDLLKKRRAASGVISEPDRFVFRVVQRY